MFRLIKTLLLLAALLGVLYAAARYPPTARRASLIYRKVSGDLPGVAWRELGARIAPEHSEIQTWIAPGPDHLAQKLDYPIHLAEDWKMYRVFHDRSGCLSELDVHFSVLKAGKTPHELHRHWEEEVLIPVAGEADILRAGDVDEADPEVQRIAPGQFVYHPTSQPHTIRGVEPGPSTYLVIRWANAQEVPERDAVPPSIIDYRPAHVAIAEGEGFTTKLLFEGPTAHLDKLHAHASTLRPGAGYDPHPDNYDVVILLLEGTVETIGQRVTAPSAIVYSAHDPHGMSNPGDTPAKYVVFELHGCGPE